MFYEEGSISFRKAPFYVLGKKIVRPKYLQENVVPGKNEILAINNNFSLNNFLKHILKH